MLLFTKWNLNSTDEAKRISAINELLSARHPKAAELISAALSRAMNLVEVSTLRPSNSQRDSGAEIIQNANVQRAAADALGQLGDACAVDVLARALKDGSGEYVRVAAATALGRIRDKRALEPLLGTFSERNPSWRILAAVVTALGESGDQSVLPPLQSLLTRAQARMTELAGRYVGDDSTNRQFHDEDVRDTRAASKEIQSAIQRIQGNARSGTNA